MSHEEAGANTQNILVALSHIYDVVMDEKVILVMREPDIEKAYPRIQLRGQVKVAE